MIVPNGLLAIGPIIFELRVMKIELWVIEIDDPNTPLVFQKKPIRRHYDMQITYISLNDILQLTVSNSTYYV